MSTSDNSSDRGTVYSRRSKRSNTSSVCTSNASNRTVTVNYKSKMTTTGLFKKKTTVLDAGSFQK